MADVTGIRHIAAEKLEPGDQFLRMNVDHEVVSVERFTREIVRTQKAVRVTLRSVQGVSAELVFSPQTTVLIRTKE